MLKFREIGHSSMLIAGSLRLFFTFLGHFFLTLFNPRNQHLTIHWAILTKTIYLSGARLMLPVSIISGILGFSLALTLFPIFNGFHLGRHALPIAQMAVVSYLAPLSVGIILSIQSALNLINASVHELQLSLDETMYEYIFPVMLGIILTGVLLYVYALFAALVGVYLTFQYVHNVDVYDHLVHLANTISWYTLDYSLLKVFIYCIIIALVVGYYYYKIALRLISLRKAVSRVMTRSLLCIIVFSAYSNIFNL